MSNQQSQSDKTIIRNMLDKRGIYFKDETSTLLGGVRFDTIKVTNGTHYMLFLFGIDGDEDDVLVGIHADEDNERDDEDREV